MLKDVGVYLDYGSMAVDTVQEMRRRWWWVPWAALLMLLRLEEATAELLTLVTGLATIGGLTVLTVVYDDVKCKFFECCSEPYVKMDFRGLRRALNERVYGQHLVAELVADALEKHQREEPKKALVLSFHGWTGSGKNHVAKIIAEGMFKNGMRSKFVHMYVSTLHFYDRRRIAEYKADLVKQIFEAGKECSRSLFIFDEVDKMPEELLNALHPFLASYSDIKGIDFRRNVFIFLSNEAGQELAAKVYDHHSKGMVRESLTMRDLDGVAFFNAFNADNEKPVHFRYTDSFLSTAWNLVVEMFGFSSSTPPFEVPDKEELPEGNLRRSELVSSHLIDLYVPFLPLERKHVLQCIRNVMSTGGWSIDERIVEEVANDLQYFPRSNSLFSASGCKRVEQKVANRLQELPKIDNDEL